LKEALRVLGNNEDAEDALREGLLSAFRNLHCFEGRARFSTWLSRIVINAALMRQRSLRARESESIEAPIPGQGHVRLSDLLGGLGPEEICARMQQRGLLRQGLRGLSQPYRRALSLQVFHGPKEVAHRAAVNRWAP
jgi:RNA polymerase sigma-70 factor (ECF subfamily)